MLTAAQAHGIVPASFYATMPASRVVCGGLAVMSAEIVDPPPDTNAPALIIQKGEAATTPG